MKRFLGKTVPLYVHVRNAILEAIVEGEIAQNDRLPSEEALASLFSVSRPTVRSALQLLENDGIISKHHGSETMVNRSCLDVKVRIDEDKSYMDLIAQSGHTPSVLTHSFRKVHQVDAGIEKRLGLAHGEPCYEMAKVLAGDGIAIMFCKEYIPCGAFYKLPEPDKLPIDIFQLADNYLHHPLHYSILEISSLLSAAEVMQAMKLEQPESMICIEELHHSVDNVPLAYSMVFIRDSILRPQLIRRRMR